jgi:iron complex transport system ATP-binding protein
MALELRQVTVTAGRARLIEDVSLRVEPGTLTVILGANGAGKSTALGVLAGDLRPSMGEASLDGVSISGMPPLLLATRRAVVLQHAPMNFSLRVHEIVSLSRMPHGRPASRGDEVEERACRALGLSHLVDRDYATLSGGERQRVQIARAMAQLGHGAASGLPGYLLMDEPTAHLDLKHQILALEAARAFADEGGGALCILHDLGLAREFSDRVVLMKAGRLTGDGKAAHLLTDAAIAQTYDITADRARRLAMHP